MPFTVNVGPYEGGQFLSQGLSNLGAGIGKGWDELQQAQKDAAGGDIILNLAKQQKLIDPATEAQYHNGSLSTKNGIIANLVKGFALDQQAKQMAAQEEARKASAELRKAQAEALGRQQAALNWSPTVDDRTRAQRMGYDYTWDPIKGFVLTPYQGDAGGGSATGEIKARTIKDETGADTGLIGITMPGTKQMSIQEKPTQGIEYDEPTGQYGRRVRGQFVPLSPQQQIMIQLEQQRRMRARATPTATPGGPNIWQRNAPTWLGGATPTPAPTAAPAGGGPVRVNSPAEAMALPPGTIYQTPDGQLKRR